MKPDKGFQLATVSNLVGIGAILFLQVSKAVTENRIWFDNEQSKSQLQAQVSLENAYAESAKQIADTYSKNQIARFNQLIISNYTLSDRSPVLNWQHTVNPNKKTYIYDQYRRCIGYAHQGLFYFIKQYPEACHL